MGERLASRLGEVDFAAEALRLAALGTLMTLVLIKAFFATALIAGARRESPDRAAGERDTERMRRSRDPSLAGDVGAIDRELLSPRPPSP